MKNFVVYKSSAGSGKTFTLVKEYLRLSLSDDKKLASGYRRILAITFTNKAAAEMKARVIQALHQISTLDTMPAIGKMLCAELRISEPELKRRADFVLRHILHHYSDFSIGTIDSFTHKIVKTFAHDLKLPVNFNVELDIQGFYEKVISLLLSSIGEDPYVSGLLREYVLAKAEDNASWDPEQQMLEFTRLLQKEDSDDYIRKLKEFSAEELEGFRKQFIDYTRHYRQELRQKSAEALDLIKRAGLTDEDFSYKKSGPQSFFRKCAAASVTLADTESPRLSEAISRNKWAARGSEERLRQLEPVLSRLATELREFIQANYSYYSLCEILSKQMYPLMLLKKIEEISEVQKQEERLVFISEFNQKIFDIINNEPTPFIYERLGDRYQHYLLDEFQDTSTLQWHNILPLIDNSLSNGWYNLIVGDGKQSIYRWRNANVKQFAGLPSLNGPGGAISAGREDTLVRNFEARILNANYRSYKNIISFNNAFFAEMSAALLSGDFLNIYDGQEQEIRHTGEGYITAHTGKVAPEDLDGMNCRIIGDKIRQALADGFRYKDICVLARKNFHGNIVAGHLMEEKIPVVSSDSLLLKNNLEVNTLVALLRYLNNRRDHISAAAVLNYTYHTGKINQETLNEQLVQIGKGANLFEALAACGIHLPEESLAANNLFDNCILISKALELERNAYHYLRFFLDEVNEFLVTKNPSLPLFFDWWESRLNKSSMIIPDTTDAVKIMTIHASKGLEFPVVIIPYCNWAVYRAGDSWVQVKDKKVELPVSVVNLSKKAGESGFAEEFEKEQQEQLLDNLNLLYVAFTRAVERLHIIAHVSDTNRTKTVADWIGQHLEGHYPSSSGTYEIGEPLKRQPSDEKHAIRSFSLAPLTFDTNPDAVRIKAAYLNKHEETENAKQHGIVLHTIMSAIAAEQDIDRELEKALLEGLILGGETEAFRSQILAIIRHPELRPYFSSQYQAKPEAELVTAAGEVLRPDRVVFAGDEVVIIDYKTGGENNPKYFRQLQRYGEALASMGYKKIKKMLVYVDETRVVAVN